MDQRKKIPLAPIYYVMVNSKLIAIIFELKLNKKIYNRPSVDEIRSWAKSFDKLMRSSGKNNKKKLHEKYLFFN